MRAHSVDLLRSVAANDTRAQSYHWCPRGLFLTIESHAAAYDVFPCQYQLFYRGKAKNSLWYDPVFKVLKINGGQVWRRRHYRCVRAEIPGTFNFSVLDNGVTSKCASLSARLHTALPACEPLPAGAPHLLSQSL